MIKRFIQYYLKQNHSTRVLIQIGAFIAVNAIMMFLILVLGGVGYIISLVSS